LIIPPELRSAAEKERTQIKKVIKEKAIDDYIVIAYEDFSGEYCLGYIRDDVLYCLDYFNIEKKRFFNSITFSPFENVLGTEKGFVVGLNMGKYVQYTYYGVYNGVPKVLTYCLDNVKGIDLNNDGMKEIVYTREATFATAAIQVIRGGSVYQCNVREDIVNKIHSLKGISLDYLNCIEVLYDEEKNAFKFSTGPVKREEGYIQGYVIW